LSQVIWTETALDHLEAIQTYIAESNPEAAQRVAARLVEAGNSLTDHPHRGRPVPRTTMRELITAPYPYIIRYRVAGNQVFILRVRHTARRPTTP
jgi:toxin ParE1/3/4